jgi:quinol monooxygenase YgiN
MHVGVDQVRQVASGPVQGRSVRGVRQQVQQLLLVDHHLTWVPAGRRADVWFGHIPKSITVIATITPLAEHRNAVRAAFLGIMVEQWSSREALKAHQTAPALAQLGPLLEGRVAGPAEVLVLDPVLAGAEGKGLLRP